MNKKLLEVILLFFIGCVVLGIFTPGSFLPGSNLAVASSSSSSAARDDGDETQRIAVTLSSSSITVDVDYDTGRILLSTTGGREDVQGEEKKNLLFYDEPPSSYTVVFADGDAFVFGEETGQFVKRPVREGNRIEAVWENKFVEVSQYIELIRREATTDEDGVLITYTVENKRTVEVDTGLQILFDTYLGEDVENHFELPGNQSVRYETVYEGVELPHYWLSHAGKEGPICLRGVLYGDLVTPPDKLIFANYRALSEELFDYSVRRKKGFDLLPYSRDDSAVALLFEPTALEPNKSKEFSAIIGLCGLGEYVKGEVQVEEKEIVEIAPPEEESVTHPEVKPDIDLAQIQRMLLSIDISRESLERINAYIKDLNSALEDREVKALSDEEIVQLRSMLEELLTQ